MEFAKAGINTAIEQELAKLPARPPSNGAKPDDATIQ
jgi:hypothetical protein